MLLNFNLRKGYQERSSQPELNKNMITIATTDFSLLSMVKKSITGWLCQVIYQYVKV